MPADTRRVCRQHEEADALGTRAARLTHSKHENVGGVSIQNVAVLTIQQKPVTIDGTGRLNGVGIGATPGRHERQGGRFAAGDIAQVAGLLCFAAGDQQRVDRKADGGEKGGAEQSATHLLLRGRQLDKPQSQATKRFGDMQGGPHHVLADLLPERFAVAALGHHRLTHGGGGGDLGEKSLGGVADHLLLFGKTKFHATCLRCRRLFAPAPRAPATAVPPRQLPPAASDLPCPPAP